ncbi:MAG: polysaccharide pyruvyl transferase family protein [Deltaproteobacteria bacterium]|nr:polysaccharide pyruvyl transferase family protein [Deltaproteobacteria bacterium]
MTVKKIGLITTLNSNIGDDFIREGICRILDEIFKNKSIEFVSVNKHKPYTAYPAWHPIHLMGFTGRLHFGRQFVRRTADSLFSAMGFSRFDSCDLIVQCGAPVFWPNCHLNEWAKPLWKDIIGRLHERIPVFNLAAGSCYPWERQPSKIDTPEDEKYLRAILGYCRLTTVRDRLSHDLCATLSHDVPLIPCSALLVGRGRKAPVTQSGYILINYMAGGGHYAWNQEIDNRAWEKTVKSLIARLSKRHKLAFLCHDEQEFCLTKKLAPELPVFFPKSSREYLQCVSGAMFAVCNRMHASVAMAGLGIPSIAICTDTRLLMVSQIGLATHYVKDVTADGIEDEAENGLKSLRSEQDRLLALQSRTWERYTSAVKEALCLL